MAIEESTRPLATKLKILSIRKREASESFLYGVPQKRVRDMPSEIKTTGRSSVSAFAKVLEDLGRLPEGKGLAFEKAAKWWLTKDPYWSSFFDSGSVRLWNESDLRDGPDIGIDLTAKDSSGRTWAIQVKNWSSDVSLPKSEVDKFLSASNTRAFDARLLLTTTKSISSNALRAIEQQEKPCVVVDYVALEESKAWARYGDVKTEKSSRIARSPLPHQVSAVKAITGAFVAGARRTQLIMACGTGKTYTSQRIAEKLGSETVLVLVPSLILLQQTRQSWYEDSQSKFQSLAVCSDTSVAADEFSQRTIDLPFPVTTSPQEISQLLQMSGKKVIFSTYQSYEQVSRALETSKSKIDLVICDEAHRLAGTKKSLFSKSLMDPHLSQSRYLFMTATPKVFVPGGAESPEDPSTELVSMSDESQFGKIGFKYSFSDAIEEKTLADYRVLIVGVTDSQVQSAIDDRVLFQLSGAEVDAEMLAAHIGLAKAMSQHNVRRVISFHSRINRARDFASFHTMLSDRHLLPLGSGKLALSEVLTGSDSAFARRKTLDRLAQVGAKEFGLVTNARCLTEGVDVPSLEGVAFIDPKSSQIDIVQAVGRAIRRGQNNKDFGYIILPIFVSSDEVSMSTIEPGRFKHVIAVMNALRSHDDSLVVEIDDLRRALGRRETTVHMPEKFFLNLPEDIPSEFVQSITSLLIQSSSESWEESFGRLLAVIKRNGGIDVPSIGGTEEEKALYTWISAQRSLYAKGTLRRDRQEKLEALEIWTWSPFDDAWETGFEALKKHLLSGGTTTVHRDFKVDGIVLANWIRVRRHNSERLSSERKAALEALPGWSWSPFEEKWQEKYDVVARELLKNGDLLFPDLAEPEKSQVREWLASQRKHRFTRLSENQRISLEKLPGWAWSPLDGRWAKKFRLLEEYFEEFGTSRVPANKSFKGARLGAWVSQIRGKRERLEPHRISQLESLRDWTWTVLEDNWNHMFSLLSRWCAKHPGESIPANLDIDGELVGQWVSRQKRASAALSLHQRASLDGLANWSWTNEDPWMKRYNLVLEVAQSTGSLPRLSYVAEGLPLGSWLSRQRIKLSSLPYEQRQLLQSLPGWTQGHQTIHSGDDPFISPNPDAIPSENDIRKKREWLDNFELLQKYVSEFGSADIVRTVIFEERKLGAFVAAVRRIKEKISPTYVVKLESLKGWTWDPIEDRWLEKLRSLRAYSEEFGTARAPQGTVYKDVPIGTWVSKQRQNRDKLDMSKVSALEALQGWKW